MENDGKRGADAVDDDEGKIAMGGLLLVVVGVASLTSSVAVGLAFGAAFGWALVTVWLLMFVVFAVSAIRRGSRRSAPGCAGASAERDALLELAAKLESEADECGQIYAETGEQEMAGEYAAYRDCARRIRKAIGVSDADR